MKSLKMITLIASIAALSACGPSNYFGSAVHCEDRMCTMSSDINIDQSEVDGVQMSSLQKAGDYQTMGLVDQVLALTPTLTLVGTIAPPYVNGTQVQASDITVSGTKAYVAYNTAGEVQDGAVDVIDISNLNAATLVSEALYSSMDIHKVLVNGGKLYTAGADYDGAVLKRITLDANGKLTSTIESKALRSIASASVNSYAGTSVVVAGTNVFATSGNNGGLSVLNTSDLSQRVFTPLADARDVATNAAGTSVYVVTGKTNVDAAITRFDVNGVQQSSGNVNLLNAVVDQGKSTVLTGATFQIATAGQGGTRLICLSNGGIISTATNPTAGGMAVDRKTANAATYGGGYMFVANGEAGVAIYSVNVPLIPNGCTGVTITYLGRFTFGTDASVNNVYYTNGHLVVATGTYGFKIVKVTTSILSGLLQAL